VHVPRAEGKNFVGTPRYGSIYAHQGFQQSRRDDLESLGYLLLHFRKKLPWQGLGSDTADTKHEKILHKKMQTPLDELCKGEPREFITYLKYCRSLGYEEAPDYAFLTRLWKGVLSKTAAKPDALFDWNTSDGMQQSRTPELPPPAVPESPPVAKQTDVSEPSPFPREDKQTIERKEPTADTDQQAKEGERTAKRSASRSRNPKQENRIAIESRSRSRDRKATAPCRRFAVGDRVLRKGKKGTILKVDETLDPPSYTVRMDDATRG
jgi:hypothetical protein